MSSRNSIKLHNIHLPHIFTRRILTKNSQNQYSELSISEYDISEAFNPDQNYFSPKQIYFSLSHHLYEILKRNLYANHTIFSFSIYKNKEIDNYEIIVKDTSITVSPSESLDSIHERVNIIINNFPDTIFPISPDIISDYCLIFVKYEIFPNEDDASQKSINSENTYVTSNCLICSITPPNVLFCNCGHLVVCENCYRNYNKKQCVSCRMLNTIVRIIE